MEHSMACRFWLAPLVALAAASCVSSVAAQNINSDEAFDSGGAATHSLALTPVQRNAIYNAVLHQRARAPSAAIEPAVGAAVPRTVALSELPDTAGIDNPMFLKYAMVGDDILVVDSVLRRVVDIIHGGGRP
jgi:hypothetical protein